MEPMVSITYAVSINDHTNQKPLVRKLGLLPNDLPLAHGYYEVYRVERPCEIQQWETPGEPSYCEITVDPYGFIIGEVGSVSCQAWPSLFANHVVLDEYGAPHCVQPYVTPKGREFLDNHKEIRYLGDS